MKQKFSQLSFVKVNCDRDIKNGIVAATYSQLYGGKNIGSYSVYKLVRGVVVDQYSWIDENELVLADTQDRMLAENLIENYNLKGQEED